MKRLVRSILIATCVLVLGLSGCSLASDQADMADGGTPTGSRVTEQPDGSTTPGGATTDTETPPAIPPGSLALFATMSGGSQSDFLRVTGGNVSWDSTHYKFLRYIPEVEMLDEFGWTSSKSYSKTYIYGITAGDWVYVVKCFTSSGRKDITRVDPKTGNWVGQFSPITTNDMYGGFTISGDRVYYRSKVSEDWFGNRSGGGHLMAGEIGGGTVELLDYYDDDLEGGYRGIGDELITILTTYQDNGVFYDIYRVDPDTGRRGDLLYSFGSPGRVTFYAGDTSLFWTETNSATGEVDIVKFTLSESPVYFLEITDTSPSLLTIDESQGKVLITFNDDTPESPLYYLTDLVDGDVVELDIDSGFYSRLKNGNGQFIILE